jgi:hypothetical protein
MPFISDATLTKLVRIANKALVDDCTLERNSVQNGQVSSTVVEQVKSLLGTPSQSSLGRSTYEDFQGNMFTWPVTLPLGTNSQEGDILTIKGQKMSIQQVLTPKSYAVFEKVLASGVKA